MTDTKALEARVAELEEQVKRITSVSFYVGYALNDLAGDLESAGGDILYHLRGGTDTTQETE